MAGGYDGPFYLIFGGDLIGRGYFLSSLSWGELARDIHNVYSNCSVTVWQQYI